MTIVFNPFSSTKRKRFVKVGSDTDYVYLVSSGGIHPVERTEEVEELESKRDIAERNRLLGIWNVMQVTQSIAEREGSKRGLGSEEAHRQIFGKTEGDDEEEKGQEQEEKGQVRVIAADQPEANGKLVRSPIKYVQSEAEFNQLFAGSQKDDEANAVLRQLKRVVATKVMASRLGWNVNIESATPVQLTLSKPLFFPLEKGQKLIFGETVVTVAASADTKDDYIPVERFSGNVSGVGFLLDESGEEKSGCEWTQAMTDAMLVDPQIDAIFAFYQEEDAGGNEKLTESIGQEPPANETEEERLGKSSTSSKEEVLPLSTTGVSTTIDSKPQVAKIGG